MYVRLKRGFVIITIHGDALIIEGDSLGEVNHVKSPLTKEFEMKN